MVLCTADKVVVTSKTTKKEFEAITSRPVRVITNGYDPEAYQNRHVQPDPAFTISHIGSLLSGRDPDALWKAISELAEENIEFRKALKLRLVGIISPGVMENIKQYKLHDCLELLDYVSHGEVVELQQRSQILLLVEINRRETAGILPGKLFEYLAAGRPILAVGPTNWEAGEIIRELQAGAVFNYSDGEAMKGILREWFEQFRAGKLESRSRGVSKYSRKEITRHLARELIWE
jgi:glycosyltransferase involved in cell wall biosynthesis